MVDQALLAKSFIPDLPSHHNVLDFFYDCTALQLINQIYLWPCENITSANLISCLCASVHFDNLFAKKNTEGIPQ